MNFYNNLKLFLWLTFLTGVLYPLLITAIAQLSMKEKAEGSLIDDKGSKLIAQKFTSERYFWPRPSSVDYNPLPSGASNLGPTSSALKKAVDERKANFQGDAPAELLFASASGLDPHISPETAYFQIDRIAKARGIDKQLLRKVIDEKTEKPFLHFIGCPCVNVFLLNMTLDEISDNGRRSSKSGAAS